MCFAPIISLSTFAVELFLATIFLLKNTKDRLNRILALVSFLLGFYQLNEYLICSTGSSIFTRLAMMTTAVLPAIAVSYALIMARKKLSFWWHLLIYSPGIYFAITFSFVNNFSTSAVCDTVFIQYPSLDLIGSFYLLYYMAYIVGTGVLFYFFAHEAKTKQERILLHLGMLSMAIFTVPTGVFLIFLPMFTVQFPSVLCEFALLLAIELIVILWYKDRHGINY